MRTVTKEDWQTAVRQGYAGLDHASTPYMLYLDEKTGGTVWGPVAIGIPCSWDGCHEHKEAGMLYCQQHLGEEINRHLEQGKEWEKATLTCDMEKDCKEQVAMIDSSGFIYCHNHGLDRRDWEPCRKLRDWELRRLEKGKPLTRY